MLVISRKESRNAFENSLLIGDDIEVYIVKVKGKQVYLGIKAPKDITITRKDKLLKTDDVECLSE